MELGVEITMAGTDQESSDGVLGRLSAVLSIIAAFGVPTYAFGLAAIAYQFQMAQNYHLSFPDSWEAVSLMPATSVIAYGANILFSQIVGNIILLEVLVLFGVGFIKFWRKATTSRRERGWALGGGIALAIGFAGSSAHSFYPTPVAVPLQLIALYIAVQMLVAWTVYRSWDRRFAAGNYWPGVSGITIVAALIYVSLLIPSFYRAKPDRHLLSPILIDCSQSKSMSGALVAHTDEFWHILVLVPSKSTKDGTYVLKSFKVLPH